MDEIRLEQLEKSIEEIKEGQAKITRALMGDYSGDDDNSIGLVEKSRNLRKEVNDLKNASEIHEAQINEVMAFKSDTKKLVAGIALVVPFIFEALKLGVSALWEIVSRK